jgi:xeroderma pigmentosum group C-complementing protein
MPPKSKGRDVKGKGNAVTTAPVSGRMGRSGATKPGGSSSAVPDVFKDMLAETVSPQFDEEKPRKRRRKVQPTDEGSSTPLKEYSESREDQGENEESTELEDIISPKPEQTAYNDYDDTQSEEDLEWEEVETANYVLKPENGADEDNDLELTLAVDTSVQQKSRTTRRRVVNNTERALRLIVHKMHILCLLPYLDRRNSWCNDSEVQNVLKSLLTKQMIECLKPKESYTQFGKAESVKKGLGLVAKMWETRFLVITKGMQRAYWAESEQEVQNVGDITISFCLTIEGSTV